MKLKNIAFGTGVFLTVAVSLALAFPKEGVKTLPGWPARVAFDRTGDNIPYVVREYLVGIGPAPYIIEREPTKEEIRLYNEQ